MIEKYVYECEICGVSYQKREEAEKCEAKCKYRDKFEKYNKLKQMLELFFNSQKFELKRTDAAYVLCRKCKVPLAKYKAHHETYYQDQTYKIGNILERYEDAHTIFKTYFCSDCYVEVLEKLKEFVEVLKKWKHV